MERWSGVLRTSLNDKPPFFKIAASLCLSPSSKTLAVPSANAIFFSGDRVEGTGNPVIERLSDALNIAEILVSKLGVSVNAWVVEAAVFNGPFAVYREFVPSVNSWGEPRSYAPNGFPASSSTLLLLSKCLEEVKNLICDRQQQPSDVGYTDFTTSMSCTPATKTIVIGFSKGGVVLNQLLTEVAHTKFETPGVHEENQIFPTLKESLLGSISGFHYVDVGLNSSGAYLTDELVIKKISENLSRYTNGIRFALHGTPRQWCDKKRLWIRNEKDRLLQLLKDEACRSEGKLQVCERYYFADRSPDLQMHFEIIENLDMH